MTALAFLFAVFLARPCPFYILDEVEAALDDLNLDRFLALLRRYANRAQFIVITHQKRTMEAADWLYGVSMGGDGVSKVLSRRLPAEARSRRARGGASARRGGPLRHRRAARGRATGAICSSRAEPPRRPRRAREPRAHAARRALPRLRESMRKTRQALGCEIQATFRGARRAAWERLEEALIMADVGARTTASVVVSSRPRRRGRVTGGEALSERLIELLAQTAASATARIDMRARPTVIMAVGVNGTGKTTTRQARLAPARRARLQRAARRRRHLPGGRARAAEGWAERAGCEIVTGAEGSDPGAVAFEAIAAGARRRASTW